jgi:hypothetical protein
LEKDYKVCAAPLCGKFSRNLSERTHPQGNADPKIPVSQFKEYEKAKRK